MDLTKVLLQVRGGRPCKLDPPNHLNRLARIGSSSEIGRGKITHGRRLNPLFNKRSVAVVGITVNFYAMLQIEHIVSISFQRLANDAIILGVLNHLFYLDPASIFALG